MKKILIIDDEPRICDLVKKALERLGDFTVSIATSGQDGINTAKDINPDLILLDIRMPNMNGIEVLKIFKKDEKMKNIPVIMLTALLNELVKNEFEDEDNVQFLEKPIELVVLKSKIEETLKKNVNF